MPWQPLRAHTSSTGPHRRKQHQGSASVVAVAAIQHLSALTPAAGSTACTAAGCSGHWLAGVSEEVALAAGRLSRADQRLHSAVPRATGTSPNGEYPDSSMKRITPTLHMSTAGEYACTQAIRLLQLPSAISSPAATLATARSLPAATDSPQRPLQGSNALKPETSGQSMQRANSAKLGPHPLADS